MICTSYLRPHPSCSFFPSSMGIRGEYLRLPVHLVLTPGLGPCRESRRTTTVRSSDSRPLGPGNSVSTEFFGPGTYSLLQDPTTLFVSIYCKSLVPFTPSPHGTTSVTDSTTVRALRRYQPSTVRVEGSRQTDSTLGGERYEVSPGDGERSEVYLISVDYTYFSKRQQMSRPRTRRKVV